MTTEEYLNSIQTYEKRIEIKTMELCRLKTMSNNVRKSNLDERVQNNTQSKDSVGDAVAKIIDLEKNVDSVVDDFIRKRNEIIKKLDRIEYISINSKTQILTPTNKGEKVYDIVKKSIPDMLNPKLTASWEKGLEMVANKEIEPEEFMKKLEKYIKTRFERFIYK